MLSLRDETLLWVLEPLLDPVSTSKGATMVGGKRVSLSPRGTISNRGGIAEQAPSARGRARMKSNIDVRTKENR